MATKFEVGSYDGRRAIRSLADALDKLSRSTEGGIDDTLEIATYPVKLFDGRRTGCVSVVQRDKSGEITAVVQMPSSGSFTAVTTLGERLRFPIAALHGARCDADGNVKLASGQFVHCVHMRPIPFYDFSRSDDEIVCYALQVLAEESCFRELDPTFAAGFWVLDYSKVAKVRIAKLKPIVSKIIKRFPSQTYDSVVSTLTRAGMQLPRRNAPQS